MQGLSIIKTSHYTPNHVVTNDDLKEFIDTSDEWITSRTGVSTRYFAKNEQNIDLAMHVTRELVEGIPIEEIGAIIVATFTPDYQTPSMACMIQKQLELPSKVLAFDLNAACSGFLYGLYVARGLLFQDPTKKVLLVGSEKISPYMDFTDRNTCILFGDGAGGVLLTLSDNRNDSFEFQTYGDDDSIVCRRMIEDPYIHMNGKAVYSFAVNAVLTGIQEVLGKSNKDISEINHFVCHQANIRIIKYVYEKLNLDPNKFFINLNKYGNTSGASIPIALSEMNQQGLLSHGDTLILIGFGAGLTWGASLLTW
ncbi:MAG: beta-ketoacyl-ACP synthase III [Eubacteriales bacterium]